jgi:hypothetical protein
MDYSDGIELNRFQWDAIHNPALLGDIFQTDEDGALFELYFALHDHNMVESNINTPLLPNNITYYAPSGLPFSLPQAATQINNSGVLVNLMITTENKYIPKKCLTSFKLNGKVYVAMSDGTQFLGYFPEFTTKNAIQDTYSLLHLNDIELFDLTDIIINRKHVGYPDLNNFTGDYLAKGNLITEEEILRCHKCHMPVAECFCGRACFCYAHKDEINGINTGECFINRLRPVDPIGISFFKSGHLDKIEFMIVNGNKYHNFIVNEQGMKLFYQRIGANFVFNFDEAVRQVGYLSKTLELSTGNNVFKILNVLNNSYDH